MAYPPTLPPATRTDSTAAAGLHAGDHNALASALTDVVAELGTDPAGGFADLTTRLAGIPADPVAKAYVDSADTAVRSEFAAADADLTTTLGQRVRKFVEGATYAAGETVLAPDGQLVSAKSAFTSGGAYNPNSWTPAAQVDHTGRARQRNKLRRDYPSRPVRVALPAAFGWQTAPLTIYKAGKSYTTDLDVKRYRHTGGTTYYVGAAGSTTNDGLTPATAFPHFTKALSVVADGDTIVLLGTGVLHRAQGFSGTRIRKSVNIVADQPGKVVLSYSDALAWTATAGRPNVFESARTNVDSVVDRAVGRHGARLPLMASLDACAATPGSWFQLVDGTGPVYVHTVTGVAPDNQRLVTLLQGAHVEAQADTQAVHLYLEGITILGGGTGNLHTFTGANNLDVYAVDCAFLFSNRVSATQNAVHLEAARFAFFQRCAVVGGTKDGLNYVNGTKFLEVDVESYGHGRDDLADNTHNASTAHTAALGIRVGGKYHDTKGVPVADVHVGTQTVNYSCAAWDSRSTDTAYSNAWAAQQDGTTMWLFDCLGFGASLDLYTTSGASLYADGCEYDTASSAVVVTNPA